MKIFWSDPFVTEVYLQEKANAINFFELLFFLENFLLPNLNKI